jgi:hypothetical protein
MAEQATWVWVGSRGMAGRAYRVQFYIDPAQNPGPQNCCWHRSKAPVTGQLIKIIEFYSRKIYGADGVSPLNDAGAVHDPDGAKLTIRLTSIN